MSTGAEYRYAYDDLGQLKREDNTVTGKTYIYDYDDAGNITSKKTYTLTAAGVTPSGQPSTASYGYNDSWGDLLTSYNGVTISYDAIGNPLSYYNGKSYTFTWKNGRQLATAVVNGNTLSFNYNDESIRTSKTVNGVVHTYHLSGSDIIAEEWGNNLIVYLYDADGSPMGMQYRTSSMAKGVFYTFWFEKNLQGDIVAVYNSSGTKLISYTYDAWGNCTTTNHNISGTNSYATYNPFRYRGYYYDSELGFYYLNSRYYDPAIGRFINADVLVSTGQGLLGYNMFAYCNNNSVHYVDTSGLVSTTRFEDVDNTNDFFVDIGGAGASYHYCVDFSVAQYSSLWTGGIYNCGYSAYSYTTGPSFSSASRTSTNTQKFIPNPNGRKGGEAHQSTIANEIKKYPPPRYIVETEAYIPTPNGLKSYRFADIKIYDSTNGQTTYINVGKQLKSGAPCAREARALSDIGEVGCTIKFVAYN